MFYLKILQTAFRALRTNMLRSLLATLGVIIGVAAVVAAMSIIEGATKEILDAIKSFGSNVIIVYPGSGSKSGRRIGTVRTLSLDDAKAIARSCPAIIRAAPEVLGGAQAKFYAKNMNCTVLGTTPSYQDVRNYKVMQGRFINNADVKGEAYVAVLGYKVAEELFGRGTPLGFVIKLGGKPFTVIGVMEKKGTLGFLRVDQQIIVPISTAMKRLYGVRSVSSISAQTISTKKTKEARKEITSLLRKRHKIAPGDKEDFGIYSQEQLLKGFKEQAQIMGVVFYSIAGISLVVGGIGIMNIMLVSVTERTREIGIRMAVGARRRDILSQFLAESGAISLIGGILGVLIGAGFSKVISGISAELLKSYIPNYAIFTALTVALVTGIISGIYPAYKASRLDPIEALRYE